MLFGAQDEATFAEFLLLAGLAMPIMNEIRFDKTHIKVLIDTGKITIPDIKQQTRRKLTSGSSKKSQGALIFEGGSFSKHNPAVIIFLKPHHFTKRNKKR